MILEYDLSTGFNLSTATFNGALDVSIADNPTDIINNDGSKAFLQSSIKYDGIMEGFFTFNGSNAI